MAVFLRATTATSGDAAWADGGEAFNPANTLIVAESGGQYTEIEDALADAVAGDTVWVFPGTYVVPVAGYTVPASVVLQGLSRDDVTLDAATNSPAAAVTLGIGAVVSDLEISMADAADVGVLMSGAASSTLRLRIGIGAGTAVAASMGISVTAANCEIRDVSYFNAMATLIDVSATGSVNAYNVQTMGNITGRAASSHFNVAGGGQLGVIGGATEVSLGTGLTVSAGSGCSLNGVSLVSLPTGVAVTGASGVSLYSCSITGALTGDASANSFYVQGSTFGSVSIAQASSGDILPQRQNSAVILSGNTSIAVAAATVGGAGYDGTFVHATMNEVDGVITIANATWDGTGGLTIRSTAATTGDRTVVWLIPGAKP